MANTRCANPEYQLDVDILMVEYVAHKAVEAQLKVLRSLSTTESSLTNGALDFAIDNIQEAMRLTEIYDTLIKLFKQNYGHERLKAGARLDAYILQVLVLLNMWLQMRIEGFPGAQHQLAPEMRRNFRRDQLVNQFFRYYWLKKREHKDLDEAADSSKAHRNRNPQLCLADHLLPHFLHLSCKMQPPDSNLDMKWMELASDFMVHAAIEIMDAPDVLEDGADVAQMALKECFAWGYVERRRFEDDAEIIQRLLSQIASKSSQPQASQLSLEECEEHIRGTAILEDEVWEMFYDEGSIQAQGRDGTNGTPLSSSELSKWTTIRQKKLDVILTTFATMQEEGGCDRYLPVTWLRNEYRLSAFLVELVGFIEIHWRNTHRSEWHGKPKLIQIEEGGLDGLSVNEFETFKAQAGIADEEWSSYHDYRASSYYEKLW